MRCIGDSLHILDPSVLDRSGPQEPHIIAPLHRIAAPNVFEPILGRSVWQEYPVESEDAERLGRIASIRAQCLNDRQPWHVIALADDCVVRVIEYEELDRDQR